MKNKSTKLKSIINEIAVMGGLSSRSPFGVQNEEKQLSNEEKIEALNLIKTFKSYEKYFKSDAKLTEVAEELCSLAEKASSIARNEPGDWMGKKTVDRNMKEVDKCAKEFGEVAKEVNSLQQRLGALYSDLGHFLERYYEIDDLGEEVPSVNEGDVEKQLDKVKGEIRRDLKSGKDVGADAANLAIDSVDSSTKKTIANRIKEVAPQYKRLEELF